MISAIKHRQIRAARDQLSVRKRLKIKHIINGEWRPKDFVETKLERARHYDGLKDKNGWCRPSERPGH